MGEIANELLDSRPAVSQHLKVLKDAGLVVDAPLGTGAWYRVDPDGLETQLSRWFLEPRACKRSAQWHSSRPRRGRRCDRRREARRPSP
jgi:DNA-binding transcriptional ArsR family regulator